MLKKTLTWASISLLVTLGAWAANNAAADLEEVSFAGSVQTEAGKAVRGATVTLFDAELEKTISVYSQEDGSFSLPAVPRRDYTLRARLLCLAWQEKSVLPGCLPPSRDLPSTIYDTACSQSP